MANDETYRTREKGRRKTNNAKRWRESPAFRAKINEASKRRQQRLKADPVAAEEWRQHRRAYLREYYRHHPRAHFPRKPAMLRAMFTAQRGWCAWHGGPLPALEACEVDHIKPKARDGSDDRANLRLLCARCNRQRGANLARSKPPKRFSGCTANTGPRGEEPA